MKLHMKTLSLFATTALLPLALGGCAAAMADNDVETVAEATNTTEKPATAAEIGAFGFDMAGMNQSVAPGDDFYAYSNGTWAKNTAIPSDKSNYGMFTALADLSQERVKKTLEAAKNDPSSKIGSAYSSFIDTAAIEAKGLAPIQPGLAFLASLPDKKAYVAFLAQSDRAGIKTPFAGYVGQDDKDPETYIYNMRQSGIGLPDRDYYLESNEKFDKIKAAYRDHLAKMLGFTGAENPTVRADAIIAFETKIAKAHWTREDSSDATKTYNKLTIAELDKMTPGFDMPTFLSGVGVGQAKEVLVAQPTAFTGIANAIADTDLQALKDQLVVRSLEAYAEVLPKAVDEQNFAFYGTTLSGTPEQQVRWKRGVGFTESILGEEVGKIYAAEYFPPQYKASINQLVDNVLDAMGRRINGLDWMQPQTKTKARQKLENFTVKVGYPDKWRDYSGLQIKNDDAFGNLFNGRRFAHEYNVGKLGTPLRRYEWGMLPQTVNAYANFGMLEVVFPAAILQPPFFDPNADDALNYGGIGAVIGHEISHHFDDQGSKYDENGKLNEWWTKEDIAAFEKDGKALIAQYDAYEALPGKFVKGEFTLGENIGDLAGLTIAYDAYKHSLGGKEAPVLGGLTGDQRFFLGWSQVWRRNYREAELERRLLTDPHAPSIQRAWVVRNLDKWYEAFDVKPGQKLYLAPEKRVKMW